MTKFELKKFFWGPAKILDTTPIDTWEIKYSPETDEK